VRKRDSGEREIERQCVRQRERDVARDRERVCVCVRERNGGGERKEQ
jgi:hypothetical protein